jgi:methylmalonyl-CoA/ethylmalonyl-CoA epimerase
MIRDVHHVGIAVRSLERACAFYAEALGLPVVKSGEAPGRRARVAVLSAGGSYIELAEPAAPDSPFARHIETHGEGLHHLALWSDDAAADVSRLREAGAPLEDRAPRDGFLGRRGYLRPEAFDGALVEVVEPEEGLRGAAAAGAITRIDHVVLRVPSVPAVCERMQSWFGIATKRTFERGASRFAFMRPGDVIIEVIGPREGGEGGAGRVAGLCFEVNGVDVLAARLKAAGHPVGEPHPAVQGGRIVSVHHSGACGVPVAFIDFAGSPGPAARA